MQIEDIHSRTTKEFSDIESSRFTHNISSQTAEVSETIHKAIDLLN
jgi:hypothetical protein